MYQVDGATHCHLLPPSWCDGREYNSRELTVEKKNLLESTSIQVINHPVFLNSDPRHLSTISAN